MVNVGGIDGDRVEIFECSAMVGYGHVEVHTKEIVRHRRSRIYVIGKGAKYAKLSQCG
jgi:hypothetical protein